MEERSAQRKFTARKVRNANAQLDSIHPRGLYNGGYARTLMSVQWTKQSAMLRRMKELTQNPRVKTHWVRMNVSANRDMS